MCDRHEFRVFRFIKSHQLTSATVEPPNQLTNHTVSPRGLATSQTDHLRGYLAFIPAHVCLGFSPSSFLVLSCDQIGQGQTEVDAVAF